ncbi:hypothetical protein M885DRAFT_598939, partial [Pelagophyceae sp. CCMP2097]
MTLLEALDAFSEPELLGEGERWCCSKCNQSVRATKALAIEAAPEVLMISLKRFERNGTRAAEKIQSHVEFGAECVVSRSRPPSREPLVILSLFFACARNSA